jgi:hypothetical protein
MSVQISNAFVKQFEREVHTAYQRLGSKLRPAVRNATNVKGSSTTFQRVGRGVATTKSSNGMVPVMNLTYSSVECGLQDFYAGDWVDRLDELKIAHDERQVIANAGAYALGRKTDELIINALNTANVPALTIADANVGMTRDKLLKAFELLGRNDIPDDGQRYAIVGWQQWAELMRIPEFTSSDFIGTEETPYTNTSTVARKWLGTTWIPYSGLSVDANDIRKCFWFHKTAVGHASGSDVQTDISWHGDRAAHFVNNMMSQGAALIDGTGVVVINCDETPD